MESYSYKKRVGGGGCPDVSLPNFQVPTSHLRFSLTPLDPTLTSKMAAKSFSSNTYEKQGEGVGGGKGVLPSFEFRVSSFPRTPATGPLPRTRRGRTLFRSPSPVLPAAALSGCVRIVR